MNSKTTINNLINEMAIPVGSLGLLEQQIKKIYKCWDKSYLKLKDSNVDKVELQIGWIMKDYVKGISTNLIIK